MRRPIVEIMAPLSLVMFAFVCLVGIFFPPPSPHDVVKELHEDLAYAEHKLELAHDLIEQTYGIRHISDLEFWSMQVAVSAYTAREEECDGSPEVTADMTPSRQGILAVSRDLLVAKGLKMGDTVLLVDGEETLGVFQIHDTMAARWTNRVDILHGNLAAARLFGVRQNVTLVKVVEGDISHGEQ